MSRRPLEIVIVGNNARGDALARMIEADPTARMNVIGFVNSWPDKPPGGEQAGPPVLGDLEKFDLVLTHHRADGVIFAVPRKMIPEVEPAVNLCAAMGIQYWIAADLFSHPSGRVGIDMVSGWPLITHEPTHQRRWDLARKRLFDLAFALFTLVASAPLLLLFAAAILVTSGRPVLFVQERCGISGRRFRMLKFRTMVREAEAVRLALATRNEMRGPVFKIADDPRVTRIGRIMRKYCLDELPQLVNVLLGHMSVVGPRPPLPSEVEQYDAWQRRRLSMRPGLTGTWQISGPNRNKISFDEWATMDLNYIDQWSFARDMKLILATIPAIVTGTGR